MSTIDGVLDPTERPNAAPRKPMFLWNTVDGTRFGVAPQQDGSVIVLVDDEVNGIGTSCKLRPDQLWTVMLMFNPLFVELDR